jgi:hypothetical protein
MMRKVIHRSTERKIDQTEGKITLETQECSGGSQALQRETTAASLPTYLDLSSDLTGTTTQV